MKITKKMVDKSIVKCGMKKCVSVGENPSGGYMVIIITYEGSDVSLFHTVSSFLRDIEVRNKLETGYFDKCEVKIYKTEIWIVVRQNYNL